MQGPDLAGMFLLLWHADNNGDTCDTCGENGGISWRSSSQCGKSRTPPADRIYQLKISDIVDRPSLRDVAQAVRSADRNASSTAYTPQDPDTDSRHEYASADITNLDEVMAVMKDTDLAIICSVVR